MFVPAPDEQTPLSQIDALCFAVARELDWDAPSAALVRRAHDASAFPPGSV